MGMIGREEGAMGFFRAQHEGFMETLATWRDRRDMVPALLSQAYSSFEGNVAFQVQGFPEVACKKGCAACCTVRVVATAPEVLLAARYIRHMDGSLQRDGVNLKARIAEADEKTRGLGEAQRMSLRLHCPFIAKGICLIHPARLFACRGHASHDRQACNDAASGSPIEVPISMPHRMVRSMVQNAMQSALRDSGYAWGMYELNHALSIALDDEGAEDAWRGGCDVFREARIEDIDMLEMAAVFDEIRGLTSPA